MKARDAYHHGNLRQALIRSSLELIRETGPAGFTLREIARRAGVSHTAPYRHFKDKDDVLAAVAEQGFRALRATMLRAIEPVRGASQRIERCGVAYIEHALKHPDHFDVMFLRTWDPKTEAGVAAEAAFRVLLDLVLECQAADVLPKDDPLVQARTAWSLVHGVATLGIHEQFRMRTVAGLIDFAASATAAIIRGMQRLPRARKPARAKTRAR
jgi:AcrR family transcriptional regulator